MTVTVQQQEEIDRIHTLLALSLVALHWQDGSGAEGDQGIFGHNVAAVLTDRHHLPVAWARNASKVNRNLSEHAEVRLMRGAIRHRDETDLHKHSVYTTLEPCVMCAGMMAMTSVRRVVFGLADPVFGGVFEKLAAGEFPYPRMVESRPASLPLAREIQGAFSDSPFDVPALWLLRSTESKDFISRAPGLLADFVPICSRNDEILRAAQNFLHSIPPEMEG